MQSLAFSIFLFVGTIASILSLIIGFWKYRRVYLVLNLLLVLALTIFASYSFFSYQLLRDEEQVLQRKKEVARTEAVALLNGLPLPNDLNYWSPGEARGAALAGLAFLEQHKELYPATFELARATVSADIQAAQARPDTSDERHTMQTAGLAMLNMLRGLAGKAP